MADPAMAGARAVDALTDEALPGLPMTSVDRIEDDLLAEHRLPEVGSTWRRKPEHGKEIVRVARVWLAPDFALPDQERTHPGDDGWTVRAHPVRGGKPIVCAVSYLTDYYERVDL